jgi:hypothetical protein
MHNEEIPLLILAKHFWRPSLRMIQVEKVFLNRDGYAFSPTQHRTSPIEELRLLHCDDAISGYILANILLSINQLKRFVFETNISSQDRERQFPVQGGFRQICQALFEHRESLEELVVANSDVAFSVSAILLCPRLNTFTNLKILVMSPFHKVY